MSTIVTRASKGSALTWTEGDANITNLNNDKIEDIVEDTSPQLGGDLDVNGNKIVSVSNGNIAIEPNGTGKITATSNIETTGDVKAKELFSTNSSGDEGGQINLAKPATNSTISGTGVIIDVYQNKLRIFEEGGSARGAYIDLTAATSSVGSNLLSGGASGITDVVQDLSPQLGGNLDVNGKDITSASNGNINIAPNGTGNILLTPASGKIVVGALDFPTGMGTNGQVLTTNGSSAMTWSTPSSGISDVVSDTSPQLGGDLDVNTRAITSASNGNIRIEPNGSGNIALTPTTGKIIMGALDFPTGMGTNGQVLTTNGSSAMTWSTVSGGISDVVSDTTPQLGGNLDVNGQQIVSASNGNIVIAPNGTGKTQISAINYNEGAIYDLGTTGGTVAPNVTNGNVQKITLNSALTLNAFTSPVAGQSLTLIIYGGTSYTSITSTMKFAGGDKALTATSGCIDILSIYYDGTNYFASLGKGFA